MAIFLHNSEDLLSQIIVQHVWTVTCLKKTVKEFYIVIRICTDIGCKIQYNKRKRITLYRFSRDMTEE